MKFRNLKASAFARILAFVLVIFCAQSLNSADAVLSGFGGRTPEQEKAAQEAAQASRDRRRRVREADALKKVVIPPAPESWDFSKTAKPFEGDVPYGVAPQSPPTPESIFPVVWANSYMADPCCVGLDLTQAFQQRDRYAKWAAHLRHEGYVRAFKNQMKALEALDKKIIHLKSEEAADTVSRGNAWKASQMLSLAYGTDVQIIVHPPRNADGKTVTTMRHGDGTVYVVSREYVIAELRRHFGEPRR